MALLQKIINICDGINEKVGSYFVCLLVFSFVALIFSNVVMRYAFNSSFVLLAELEWHLFAMIFLLGAGYTLLYERHVRVDIFFSLLTERGRAVVNCLGCVFFLIPSCYLVLSTSIPWVIDAYQVNEVSLDPGGIPARFAIKAMLPLGYGLILIQGISLFLKSVLTLMGHSPEDPANVVPNKS